MFTTNIHATEFRARKYQGGFATVDMLDGTTSKAAVFLETREKCDELIAAVSAAKSMLPSETSEPVPESAEDDAGRAIVADVSQQTARVWAVFEPTEGEVAGPFTHRDAIAWATANALSFAGPLTVRRARTDLNTVSPEEHAEEDEEDGEGQYRNRMACGDSLWDFEEHAEGAALHCPRHGLTHAITEEQWLADHPPEPIGFLGDYAKYAEPPAHDADPGERGVSEYNREESGLDRGDI